MTTGRTRARTALACLAALVAVAASAGCGGPAPTHLSAEFRDAIGLYVGNDVSVLGVKVGRVDAIHPSGTHVLVDLTVQPGIRIPAGAGAVTVSPALVNNRRVELTPVYRGGPTMPDGSVIPLARTRTPVEVDEVFDAAEKLSSQLGKVQGGKAALRDALDAAAGSFAGNGDKLHKALQGLSAATGVGADQRNQLIEVITDVDDLTQKAVRYDGTIRGLVTNLDDATQLLDSQGPKLTDTLDNVDDLLGQVTDLIRKNKDDTRDTFRNVQVTARSLADHQRELSEALDLLPTTFQNLANAIDPKRRVVRAHTDFENVLLPPQLLQGVCQQYQVPLLCAMTTASNSTNPQDVQKLGMMLLGAGK